MYIVHNIKRMYAHVSNILQCYSPYAIFMVVQPLSEGKSEKGYIYWIAVSFMCIWTSSYACIIIWGRMLYMVQFNKKQGHTWLILTFLT